MFSWIKERERLWLYGKAENGKGGDCFSYDNTGYNDGAVLQGAGIGRRDAGWPGVLRLNVDWSWNC